MQKRRSQWGIVTPYTKHGGGALRWLGSMPPARVILLSFALCILVGTVLLMLPIASKDARATPLLDALFTATSATCINGLVIFDTWTKWTIFGQAVILFFIQIGGLGLITFAVFFNIALRRRMNLRSLQITSESLGGVGAHDSPRLVRFIVLFTLCVELLGAFLLCTSFVPRYGLRGIWISVFLSVSSYCNAGFNILGSEGAFSSLSHYNGDPVVLLTIAALIIIGGLGCIVFLDIYRFKNSRKLMLHTRVTLAMTGILIALGFVAYLTLEWGNPATMGPLPVWQKLLASFFQSVTTRSAGFHTFDIAAATPVSKLVTIVLMFIGAGSSSTGGGIKVTTFAVLVMTVVCVVRGRGDTIIWGRRVDRQIVYKSLTIVAVSIIAVVLATCVIIFTEPGPGGTMQAPVDAAFESVSAFGVGMSAGVTLSANVPSRIALIAMMFLGRVGPVSLALSLTARNLKSKKGVILPEGQIVVG